jgi:hypothetical protein
MEELQGHIKTGAHQLSLKLEAISKTQDSEE